MFSFIRILRYLIILSFLLNVGIIFFETNNSFVDTPLIFLYVVLLHIVLLISTYSSDKLMPFLALSLLVFYALRFVTLQIDAAYYTYPFFMPSLDDMESIMFVLLLISCSMILGCYLGDKISSGYHGPLNLLPYSADYDDKGYYYVIISILIVSKIVLLYLLFVYGIGLPINLQFFSPILLRIAKIFKTANIFDIVPIAWVIIKKPIGIEKKLGFVAIFLMIILKLGSFSKVAILYVIIPFFFVLYIANIKIKLKQVFFMCLILIFVFTFYSSFVSSIRSSLLMAYSGGKFQYNVSFDIVSNILNFFARLGSAFDVLSLTITNKNQFLPYLSFSDEFLDIINSYFPGGLIQTNSPNWSQRLYVIGHGGSYEAMLNMRTGENIGLLGHLYIYFDFWAVCLISGCVMFFYSWIYKNTSSAVFKIIILSIIISDIGNGSGVLNMLSSYFLSIIWYYIIFMLYKLFLKGNGGHSNFYRVKYG